MNQPQSRARQVDSVLSADGRRPARRTAEGITTCRTATYSRRVTVTSYGALIVSVRHSSR